MGEDFDDVDWRTLDPRQYDPRRIIREALLDDAPVPDRTRRERRGRGHVDQCVQAAEPLGERRSRADEPPPFDTEAT